MSMRRRDFITGGAALGAGAALGRLGAPPAVADDDAPVVVADDSLDTVLPFEGRHQAGTLEDRQGFAILVACDAIAGSRAQLAAGLQGLSARARALTSGYQALLGAPSEGPTPDSGVLGPQVRPDALSVTIGFGSSLFDERYGLAGRRPAGLKPMTTFPDDDLDPTQCHGDFLLQLCANTEETLLHALRDLLRETRSSLAARWKVEGFLPAAAREAGTARNLLGFKDGTSNPDTTDDALMNELVWTGDEQPPWARRGTFAVVRTIRNRVEFWDRVALSEQELMIGRDKARGAPLGMTEELDDPELSSDPKGERIPLDSHMRLARPRTAKAEGSRILRRGYNYSRGIDLSGQLDMGLVFVSFQRSIEHQFEATQRRLAGEPLVDYVVPTGGGYFFVPSGARDPQDWVGSGLFI